VDKLVLSSEKPNVLNKILRLVCILSGTVLFVIPPGVFSATGFETGIFFLKLLGIGLIVLAVVDPISLFWKDHQLQLNDEFIKSIDELSIERTAYWNKLDKIMLSRFRITLIYNSGMAEQFQLPFISNEEFEKLRSSIQSKSAEHQFKLEEQPWWKI